MKTYQRFLNKTLLMFVRKSLTKKSFRVWGQFCCSCKVEESSTFFSGNIQYTFQYYMSPFCRSSSFFRWSSFYRLSSFLRSSSFFSLSSFFWSSSFLGRLHFRGCLHFEVIFLIYPLIRATFLQHQNPT